jgi:hypothetical protein
MNGGTISGNSNSKAYPFSSYGGGGVFVGNGGTFTMNGGAISGNSNSSSSDVGDGGGGVCVADGTFTMKGGIISGNLDSSSQGGGGVFVRGGSWWGEEGVFIMDGGEISGNTSFSGGGVYCGGGYYRNGLFTVNGGTISGNTASSGGGVYSITTVTLNGGGSSGNTASTYGGGVYSRGNFTMDGGDISGNTASTYGGGVYVAYGFTMNDGDINRNSSDAGGGVFIGSTGTFIMNGGGICENTAYFGDGVFVFPDGTLVASGRALLDPSNAVCLYYLPEDYRYSYITIGEGFDTAGTPISIDLLGGESLSLLEQWNAELLLLNGAEISQTVCSRFKPRTLFTGDSSVLDIGAYTIKTDGRGSWIPQGSEILSFKVNGKEAEIDNTLISMVVPFDTPISALAPEITLAEGASIYPALGEALDFSDPVTYTVTGPGGARKVYTVTLTLITGSIPTGGLVIIDRYTPQEIALEQDGFVIRVPGTGYSGHRWYVDNELRSSSESIDLAGYDPGNYIVNVLVYKNGIPYSAEIAVTVSR